MVLGRSVHNMTFLLSKQQDHCIEYENNNNNNNNNRLTAFDPGQPG